MATISDVTCANIRAVKSVTKAQVTAANAFPKVMKMKAAHSVQIGIANTISAAADAITNILK
ncbi:MAG: hypothetical protein IJ325_12225 [Clostridia bacterium]|nr:hypothetical protein [Clostridia bacterium]